MTLNVDTLLNNLAGAGVSIGTAAAEKSLGIAQPQTPSSTTAPAQSTPVQGINTITAAATPTVGTSWYSNPSTLMVIGGGVLLVIVLVVVMAKKK